jgi:hypothetical protein
MKVFVAEHPVDPLHNIDYTYSVTYLGKEFQVASIYETQNEEDGL